MAKFTFTGGAASFSLPDVTSKENLRLDDENFNPGAVSYDDQVTFWRISLSGDGIEREFLNITAGTVDSVYIRSSSGPVALEVVGLDFTAPALSQVLTGKGVAAFMNVITQGDDLMIGSAIADLMVAGRGDDILRGGAGRDDLEGGRGNDRLSGGDQSDEFAFMGPFDADVISDFDAKGGGNRQDYLVLELGQTYTEMSLRNGVKLDFGHGDSIVLRDVDASDFTRADIHFQSAL